MKWHNAAHTASQLATLAVALLAAACGGSGGSSSAARDHAVSGTAVKGPVAGASVTAFAVASGAKGQQLGTGRTDAQGNFTLAVGAYSGPMLLELGGGTYVDEAANATMPMASGDLMTAMLPSAEATATGVMITPLTSMAQAWAQGMTGGMTPDNMATANAAVGSYFMIHDILQTIVIDPLVAGSGAGASQDMKNYAMTLAAMSQYAKTVGMSASSSGMVTVMMQDASDGVMNGMMGPTPISMAGMGGMMSGTMAADAGRAGLATAMSQFVQSSMNKSGVTLADMQPLISHLNATDGRLGASTPGATGGTMNGLAMMGPLSAGTVTALAVGADGNAGSTIGSANVDAAGHFSIAMGQYAGGVMLRLSGATYADLATGSMMPMQAQMTAVVPAVAAGSTVSGILITPLTSIAQARAQALAGGMSDANMTAANAAVGSYFMVKDILHTVPMDVGAAAGSATADARNYAMTIAAMSEYALSLGMMTSSSGLVTLMMSDASDGVFDGKVAGVKITMGSTGGMMNGGYMSPTAGTSDLAAAMTAFIKDTKVNRTGLVVTDMQQLINRLNTSTGVLQ